MNQINAGRYGLYLIAIVVVYGAMLLAKGGLYVTSHEGDALHLIDIVLRMGQGQWPHLDFVTPLGVAAFLPIAAFVKAGFGVGMSILLAQISVAIALILPVFYVATTRMTRNVGYVFGAVILSMVMALVHGEIGQDVTSSMHYNRWAWALAFVAVPVAFFAPRDGGSAGIDGLILGLAMSCLILGKVTFAVAFAPALALALVLRKAWGAMGVAIGVVILCMAIPVGLAGFAFWQAYIGDLLEVAGSGIRPRAGVDWGTLLTGPRFVMANLVLLASIFVLRKGEKPELGLVLIVLAPGLLYVTYQNWGNDPKWLALLALILVMAGTSTKHAVLALAAAALITPSFWNMGVSPLRHLKQGGDRFIAVFETEPHMDVFALKARVNRVIERGTVTYKAPQFLALNEFADIVEDVEFQGITYPSCQQDTGVLGVLREVAADLRDYGLGDDARIFVTDLFGSLWAFGGFVPLQGGTPWYYGELPGFENSDYVLVPSCPITPPVFDAIIGKLNAMEGLELEELRRTELYTLYRKS
ncbi:hypothetical protein N9M66_03365 [Litoreibacter sp.]|nr:hypothetical protein [Litoreibacter sp.]